MRGFGRTDVDIGMVSLQFGHVADSPMRPPSAVKRCAAASQSERHRAWMEVPQHAITLQFSNARSSRQHTHTSSGATLNARRRGACVGTSSSSSLPSNSQVVGTYAGGGAAGSGAEGAPLPICCGRSASHAWHIVVPGALTSVHLSHLHAAGGTTVTRTLVGKTRLAFK